jgi:catechol 2,3-dioxygenase-like lactoylglutathione lyase family enzyme
VDDAGARDALAIRRVVETALYVDDMPRAVAFYSDALGLRILGSEGVRLTAMDAGGATVLLLFKRGATNRGLSTRRRPHPAARRCGPAHIASHVDAAEFERWSDA